MGQVFAWCVVCDVAFAFLEMNRGRQVWSKRRPTKCHMHCRNSACKNAFVAKRMRNEKGEVWEVLCAPLCACPPLSDADKRTRNVKSSLLSDHVKETIRNAVPCNNRTSKTRQVAQQVQALTGEHIKRHQCR